jgi:hypothetical protein
MTRAEFEALPAVTTRADVDRLGRVVVHLAGALRIATEVLRDDGAALLRRLDPQPAARRNELVGVLREHAHLCREIAELFETAHARALVATAFCRGVDQPPERQQ